VLVFLVAVTLLAELCDAAGFFDVTAKLAAQLARGYTWLLFLLVVVIATVTTVLLSLDTTAVLLTPVVLSMCAQLGLHPLPFAMATVWLANTASLLLPVSNLTNLLAGQQLALSPAQFVARTWAAALAAVVVTTTVLLALHQSRLRGRYQLPPSLLIADRALFWTSAGAVIVFALLILGGVNVSVAAVACAATTAVAFAVRRRDQLRWAIFPWRLVLVVCGLFLIVEGALRHGLTDALTSAAGTGSGFADLLRLAAAGAAGANAVNNLPAYLALEPVADGSSERLLAVLIGVNTGPLISIWGSLATLLWLERCRAGNVTVSLRSFALTGVLLTPAVIFAAIAALVLS